MRFCCPLAVRLLPLAAFVPHLAVLTLRQQYVGTLNVAVQNSLRMQEFQALGEVEHRATNVELFVARAVPQPDAELASLPARRTARAGATRSKSAAAPCTVRLSSPMRGM